MIDFEGKEFRKEKIKLKEQTKRAMIYSRVFTPFIEGSSSIINMLINFEQSYQE